LISPHIPLWFEYTGLFVLLVLLLPCLWVSYIWDQIIDPHYDQDDIEEPESDLLRWFYRAAKRINTNLAARTSIFSVVALLVVTSAVLDVVSNICRPVLNKSLVPVPILQMTASCLIESPKVK